MHANFKYDWCSSKSFLIFIDMPFSFIRSSSKSIYYIFIYYYLIILVYLLSNLNNDSTVFIMILHLSAGPSISMMYYAHEYETISISVSIFDYYSQ